MRIRWLLAILCLAGVAQAATAVPLSLAKLVQESDLIILGTAHQGSSRWQQGRIVTLVEFAVEEVWLGADVPSRIAVTTLGGTVNGIGQTVSGAARLPDGQRLVLHLTRASEQTYAVVGMSQGVFKILLDSTGTWQVRRDLSGLRLLSEPPREALPTTLPALRQRVEELARAR